MIISTVAELTSSKLLITHKKSSLRCFPKIVGQPVMLIFTLLIAPHMTTCQQVYSDVPNIFVDYWILLTWKYHKIKNKNECMKILVYFQANHHLNQFCVHVVRQTLLLVYQEIIRSYNSVNHSKHKINPFKSSKTRFTSVSFIPAIVDLTSSALVSVKT